MRLKAFTSPRWGWLASSRIGLLVVVGGTVIFAAQCVSAKGQIFLGPAGSGTTSGATSWLAGANGAGCTTLDFDDPAKSGGCDFTMSNTVAGRENNADWRCRPFSLGAAADGARPITFSFAYKFVNGVAPENNIHVQLRFYDATGTNFISEHVIPVGAHTGDSAMTEYRTLTFEGFFAPPKAKTADIWINANIFEPWVSGTVRFDKFSVTTMPRSLLFKAGVIAAAMTGVGGIILLVIGFWRRRAPARP